MLFTSIGTVTSVALGVVDIVVVDIVDIVCPVGFALEHCRRCLVCGSD